MKEPSASVVVLLEENGKILLLKRNLEPYAGTWCLPGGFIGWSETADNAAKRCAEEQTGLYCDVRFSFYFDEIILHKDFHNVVLCFTGDFSGDVRVSEGYSEAKWIEQEQIKRMQLGFLHQEIIAAYFKRKALQTK